MAILNRFLRFMLLRFDSVFASHCEIFCRFHARDSGNRAICDLRFCAANQARELSPKRKFLGRISRGHPGVIRADLRRKPQETADFRRKPQKTADFCRNRFLPFAVPPFGALLIVVIAQAPNLGYNGIQGWPD